MAYSTTALNLAIAMVGRSHSTAGPYFGGNRWQYISTDALATVAASSYFSDGHKRGMRKYDLVDHIDPNSSLNSVLLVTAVTTGAGATATSAQST